VAPPYKPRLYQSFDPRSESEMSLLLPLSQAMEPVTSPRASGAGSDCAWATAATEPNVRMKTKRTKCRGLTPGKARLGRAGAHQKKRRCIVGLPPRASTMKTLIGVALATALTAGPRADVQTEDQLRQYFEGKTVVVKIDMPATQEGVDVFADARRPIDFEQYRARLRSTGTAIRSGETVMITKLKVKDKMIEFQVGGRGRGAAGDDT